MQSQNLSLLEERRVRTLPRWSRPRCEAKTRAGSPCQAQALSNGRCVKHGGLSTGPITEEGRRRISEAQKRRWHGERHAAQGGGDGRSGAPRRLAASLALLLAIVAATFFSAGQANAQFPMPGSRAHSVVPNNWLCAGKHAEGKQ
jgi:hypothetical protein